MSSVVCAEAKDELKNNELVDILQEIYTCRECSNKETMQVVVNAFTNSWQITTRFLQIV